MAEPDAKVTDAVSLFDEIGTLPLQSGDEVPLFRRTTSEDDDYPATFTVDAADVLIESSTTSG